MHERERQRQTAEPSEAPLYTIKWPKADAHTTRSVSGVLVESNVRGQLALHFYNEIRELEPKVEYMEDGSRAEPPRSVTYVREITDSILLSGCHRPPASRRSRRVPVRVGEQSAVGRLNRPSQRPRTRSPVGRISAA